MWKIIRVLVLEYRERAIYIFFADSLKIIEYNVTCAKIILFITFGMRVLDYI